MATTVEQVDRAPGRRLSVLRVTAATAISALIFVVLCWIGARFGFGPGTHFISLYSDGDVASAMTLFTAICWSFLAGAVIGGIFAIIYNGLAGLER